MISVKTTINGDVWEITDGEGTSIDAVLTALAEVATDSHEALTVLKQAGIAHGVTVGQTSSGEAPPVNAGTPPPSGEAPVCEGGHGPMRDFGPKGTRKRNKKGDEYANRYYCQKFGSDCKPRD